MKNLFEDIKQLLSKGVVKLLLLIILFIVAVSVWFSTQKTTTPTVEKITYPLTIKGTERLSKQTEVVFLLEKAPNLPESLKVYQIKQKGETENISLFEKVVGLLKLTNKPSVRSGANYKVYIVEDAAGVFEGNALTGNFSFSGNSAVALDFDNDQEAVSQTKRMFTDLGIKVEKSFSVVYYYNYSGSELSLATNKTNADLIEIRLSPSINGFKVVSVGLNEPGISVTVDLKSKKINSINYFSPEIEDNQPNNYPTLSFSLLKDNVLNLLTVTELLGKEGFLSLTQVQDLAKITVTRLEIGYLYAREDNSLIKPVYFLEGAVNFTDKTEGSFKGFVPALNTTLAP